MECAGLSLGERGRAREVSVPKRVIDFDALWASDKLAACAEWAQAEYAWLYGLADASGSFEMTNLRVIWGRVAAIRKSLTLERLEQIFGEFAARGLLFIWQENGKRYGHWTGSDVPGRLPPPSWRARLERLAPPVPRDAMAAYRARFAGARLAPRFAEDQIAGPDPGASQDSSELTQGTGVQHHGLNPHLEVPQGQDWDQDLDLKGKNTPVCPLFPGFANENRADGYAQDDRTRSGEQVAEIEPKWGGKGNDAKSTPAARPTDTQAAASSRRNCSAEQLLAIYEAERGPLPAVDRWTAERRRRSRRRLAAGLDAEEFRAAVRRAAATPFLTGAGERGWRASFDWFLASDTNVRKVLEGCYDPPPSSHDAATATASAAALPGCAAPGKFVEPITRRGDRAASELRVGAGPLAEACGVRIKPAALERIRARSGAPPGLACAEPLPAVRQEMPRDDFGQLRGATTENVREKAS
jgi:hypothetical protein